MTRNTSGYTDTGQHSDMVSGLVQKQPDIARQGLQGAISCRAASPTLWWYPTAVPAIKGKQQPQLHLFGVTHQLAIAPVVHVAQQNGAGTNGAVRNTPLMHKCQRRDAPRADGPAAASGQIQFGALGQPPSHLRDAALVHKRQRCEPSRADALQRRGREIHY